MKKQWKIEDKKVNIFCLKNIFLRVSKKETLEIFFSPKINIFCLKNILSQVSDREKHLKLFKG